MPSLKEKNDNSAAEGAVKIQLRAPRTVKDIIDRAAAMTHVTRTEFMLRAAVNAAEDALLDQQYFLLDPERFDQFERTLNTPTGNLSALGKLLNKKPIWEK